MVSMRDDARRLEDAAVPVKLKLSASWIALMLLYAYGDIIAYFRPGFIQDVIGGEVFVFDIDQVFLLGISAYIAIPALMVVLSLILKPQLNRWSNIVIAGIYAVTIMASVIGDDYVYYYFLSALETAIALLIVWFAWTWPKCSTDSPV